MEGSCSALERKAVLNVGGGDWAFLNVVFDAIEASNEHFLSRPQALPMDQEARMKMACTKFPHLRTAALSDHEHNILPSFVTEHNARTNSCLRQVPWLTALRPAFLSIRYANWSMREIDEM